MANEYLDDLRLAHVLADDADALSLDRFRAQDLEISTKPDMSYVTDADQAVETGIRRTLGRSRSRDSVYGEESGGELGETTRQWIVDPIDGTANFVRGVPVWATLISLVDDGEVVVGLVSAPALGRRWWASKGAGAWTGRSMMKARRCEVSDVDAIEDASLSYSSVTSWEELGKLDDFTALNRRVWRSRAYGDFWSYMLVAEGTVDIAAEPELAVWDMAANEIIVREAGGRFTALNGADGPFGPNALATNRHLHDAAMAFLGHFPDDASPDNVHTLRIPRPEN